MLQDTKALSLDGYILDEMPGNVVAAAAETARRAGAVVAFDPGPRCFTLLQGNGKLALSALLDASDIVLLNQVHVRDF